MKKLGALIDEISFESGLRNGENMDTWIEFTIKNVLDKYTALFSYSDLLVPGTILLAGPPPPLDLIPIPDGLQRLDLESMVYSPAGDLTKAYRLEQTTDLFIGEDVGAVRTFKLLGETFQFWPTQELAAGDTIQYQYWVAGSYPLVSLDSYIKPEALIETVKLEVLARASMTLGGKQGANYISLARDARAATFGSLPLPRT